MAPSAGSDTALDNPASGKDALNWLDKFGGDDSLDSSPTPPAVRTDQPPAVAPGAEPVPAAPASTPAVATPAVPAAADRFAEPTPVAAADPAVAAPAVATPAATPEPAAAAATPQVPSTLAEDWKKIRETSIKALEKLYVLSDKDREAIGEELADVLAPLTAKAHVNIYESVMNGVYTVLPQMIRDTLAVDAARNKYEDAFYQKWPALKAHKEDVERATKVYTTLNPKAPLAQVLNEVGLQVSIAKKLPIPNVPGTGADPAAAATTDFVPAQAGGSGGAVVTKKDGAFEQFIDEET